VDKEILKYEELLIH